MKNLLRYILAIILLTAIVSLITITIMNYRIVPLELYQLDSENLMNDGGFENFNQPVGDCCNSNPGQSRVFASQSLDAFEGSYSLNLTSENHCACVFKPITKFVNSEKYLLSFYYKGNNPSTCIWVTGENICKKEGGNLEKTFQWKEFRAFLQFTNNSENVLVHFYADSSGEQVTNLYDSLEVRWLIPVKVSYYNFSFKDNEQYVIKTDSANVIHNTQAEKLNDDGYYIVTGE